MSKRGFTLVEVMIYIVLFGMLMSGAVVATYQLLEGGGRHQHNVSVQEEGTFLNRKINWELTRATGATVTSPDTLTIQPGSVVIKGENNSLTINRASAGALPLNSAAFKVANVVFSIDPASNGKPKAVHVSFEIDGKPFTFAKYLRQ